MSHLELVAVIVAEYDPAIRFYVDVLGFELVEDSPARTNDGRAKRLLLTDKGRALEEQVRPVIADMDAAVRGELDAHEAEAARRVLLRLHANLQRAVGERRR